MQKQALVVDDSRVARLTLSKLLAPYDLDIVQIASGEEALSYLETNNEKPDIIFMDVTMQGLDGLETTKRIKQNQSLSAIPIVMCTGHDTQADQDNAIAAGAIAAITKPPKEDMLADIMSQLDTHTEVFDEPINATITPEFVVEVIPETNKETVMPASALTAQLEQEWLPKFQQTIEEKVGDIARRISAETVKGMMANQQPVVAPQDNSQLNIEIATIIERDFQPKLERTIREITEDISRQIVLDSVETSIASHTVNLLPTLKEQLIGQIKQNTVEVAQQAAQQMIDQSAEAAVQYAIDDLNLAAKATVTVEQQGKAWLVAQEKQMSLAVTQQVEQNTSPLIAQYLDMNLAEKITSHLAENKAETVKEEPPKPSKNKKAEAKIDADINELRILMTELTGQVSFFKEVVIVLSIIVVSAITVALLLNVGIL